MPEIDGAVSSPEKDQAGDNDLASIVDAAIADAIPDDVTLPASLIKAERKPQTKSDQAAEGDASADEPKDAGKPVKGDAPATVEAPEGLKFPGQWDAATRAAVSALAPDAQKLVVKLAKDAEAAFTPKLQEAAEERRFAQSIRSVFTPEHRQQMANAGMDEATAVKRLLEYQDKAMRDAPGYVRWFVSRAKLNPLQLFPELAGGQPAEPNANQPAPPVQRYAEPDPQINHLLGTVNNLQNWVQSYEETQTLNEVARFRDAKDADGNPLRPYYADVEETMVNYLLADPVISQLKVTDPAAALEAAYQAAIAAKPDTRQKLIDAEIAKRTASSRKAQDIAKAKAAKSPVSSPASSSLSATTDRSRPVADYVTQAMERIGLT